VFGRGEEAQRLLAEADLPRTVRRVSWYWQSTHGTIFMFDGEIHNVYRPAQGDDVSGVRAITHYPRFVTELADAGDLPRGLRQVNCSARAAASPAEILEAVGRFPALERLSVVYPFTEAQLPPFLRAVGHLAGVELYLTMRTRHSTTQYIQEHAKGYRSGAT